MAGRTGVTAEQGIGGVFEDVQGFGAWGDSTGESSAEVGIHGVGAFHGTDAEVLSPCYLGNWSFAKGAPLDGWQKTRARGVPFKLDGCINLDELCGKTAAGQGAEGVVYVDYGVNEDGVALLGIGCNWCFEVCCDGVCVVSTFPEGNGSTYMFATNHRVFFHVTKGMHLLAIRVRRGEDHWNFALSAGVSARSPRRAENRRWTMALQS